MKKILITIFAIGFFTACDVSSLDQNPKAATNVPGGTLFANATKNLVDNMTTPSVNVNIWRLIAQYWAETTYIDESNYDLGTRNIPQTWWHNMYPSILKDLDEAKKKTETEILVPPVKANRIAIIEILNVYTWLVIVNTFGDVPYSEALDYNNLLPKYDDAETIYDNLIVRLNTAIDNLDVSEAGFDEFDLIYDGNVAAWKKFGNSIKLKIGVTLADVDATTASTLILAAAPNVFTSNNDNASFYYLASPPNTNPIWVNLVQSGRNDYVAANTLVDVMNTLNDPRRSEYFTFDNTGSSYTGGIYGSNNNFATFSHVSDQIQLEQWPGTLMDYSEVEFYLAEAVARSIAVGGTEASHYDAAITASMEDWGVSASDITTYLAQNSVSYATATGSYKQKIGNQKWIALYNRGHEAWVEWRRLDFPALVPPPEAVTAIPVRYPYPVSEQNLNTANYNAASTAIGGDDVETKLFWDIN